MFLYFVKGITVPFPLEYLVSLQILQVSIQNPRQGSVKQAEQANKVSVSQHRRCGFGMIQHNHVECLKNIQ